jgi:hypothetical protein
MTSTNTTTVQAMRAQAIASHLLHRVDTSQLSERDGVAIGGCITMPDCVMGYGNSHCEYPACKCHAMPINSEAFPPIQYAGEEPKPAGATRWIAVILVTALAVTLAVISNPETTKAAFAFLGL